MKTVGSGVAADLQKMMEQKNDGAQAPSPVMKRTIGDRVSESLNEPH